MLPVRFPPGELVFSNRPFQESLFGAVDQLLQEGRCPDGRFELETKETRLTCLIHRGQPHLAGLQEQETFSWVPLRDFPVRARQLEGATCHLIRHDPVRVLLIEVHFRSRPVLQATTELVDIEHVLDVLSHEGEDAVLALERHGTRTLLFLQKGIPARLFFGNPGEDPGEESSLRDRFLVHTFNPSLGSGRFEVFKHLKITPDPEAGTTLQKLAEAAKPPPATTIHVRLGGREVLQRPFMPPAVLIGRDYACELLLDNLSVSRRHARLCWDRGQFWIEDLESANGITLNGQPVTRAQVARFDRIGIGKFELSLSESRETLHPDATMILSLQGGAQHPGAYLVGQGVSTPLAQEVTIGRPNKADIPASGWWVRAIHVRIRPEGAGGYRLVCTPPGRAKVNGKTVRSTLLRLGDQITVGRSRFWVVPTLSGEDTSS